MTMEEKKKVAQNAPLNIEYIQEKLNEGYKHTEKAKGKDIVLLIGNTGVGKSTTGNYLLGHPMVEKKYQGRPVIETIGPPTLHIGHTVTAQTLYAEPVSHSDFPWILTDCPGFLGNRSVEDSVIESISTELAIRSSKQIKGILILISINHLLETKTLELRELMKTLIALFKDPTEMVPYSIFIITKKYKGMPEEEAREITMGAIESLKEHCERERDKLTQNGLESADGLSAIDYDTISTYFGELLKNQERIVFVNPVDAGESRKLILDKIDAIHPEKWFLRSVFDQGKALVCQTEDLDKVRPVTIEDFNFDTYNEHRTKFNVAAYDLADEAHRLMSQIIDLYTILCVTSSDISNTEKRLEITGRLQDDLLNEKDTNEQITLNSVEKWKKIILQNQNSISEKKDRVKVFLQSIRELEDELRELDTDKPTIFRHNSLDEKVGVLDLFGWKQMKFEADTYNKETVIIDVKRNCKNGKWYNEIDERKTGKYRITYKSDYHARPAQASVTAYIMKKDDPGNKVRILEINEEKEDLADKKKALEKQVSDLERANQELQTLIGKVSSSKLKEKTERQSNAERCKKDEQYYIDQIQEKQELIKKTKEQAVELWKKFDLMHHKFNWLIEISALLEFPSQLIKGFVAKYKNFYGTIEEIKRNEWSPAVDIRRRIEEKRNQIVSVFQPTQMTREELEAQEKQLLEDIRRSDAELERKKVSLEKIRRQLHKTDSGKVEAKAFHYSSSSESSSTSTTVSIIPTNSSEEYQEETLREEVHNLQQELGLKQTKLEILNEESGAKDLSISLEFQRALTDAIEKWAVAKAVADLGSTVSGELCKEAKEWGFTCKDMKHDGNCFFHAVADQLRLQNRIDLDHQKLRELTVDHIIQNWNSYKETVDQDPGTFINKISQNGTWADHQMILALSRALGMNLVIIRSDHAEPQIFKRVSATATLYIGYEVGRHYQSLIVDPRVVNPRSIQNVINRITPDLWGAADVAPVRAPAAPASSFGESPERTQRGEVHNLQQESEKNGRNVRRKHSRWDKASDNTLAPSKPAIASSSSPSSTGSSSDTVSPKRPKYASSAPNTDEIDLTVSPPASPQKTQVNPSHVLGSMFYLPSAAIPVKNGDGRLNNNSTGIIANSSAKQ